MDLFLSERASAGASLGRLDDDLTAFFAYRKSRSKQEHSMDRYSTVADSWWGINGPGKIFAIHPSSDTHEECTSRVVASTLFACFPAHGVEKIDVKKPYDPQGRGRDIKL